MHNRPDFVYQLSAEGLGFPQYSVAYGSAFRALRISPFVQAVEVFAHRKVNVIYKRFDLFASVGF